MRALRHGGRLGILTNKVGVRLYIPKVSTEVMLIVPRFCLKAMIGFGHSCDAPILALRSKT